MELFRFDECMLLFQQALLPVIIVLSDVITVGCVGGLAELSHFVGLAGSVGLAGAEQTTGSTHSQL